MKIIEKIDEETKEQTLYLYVEGFVPHKLVDVQLLKDSVEHGMEELLTIAIYNRINEFYGICSGLNKFTDDLMRQVKAIGNVK